MLPMANLFIYLLFFVFQQKEACLFLFLSILSSFQSPDQNPQILALHNLILLSFMFTTNDSHLF